jgi:hypothetical protein
MDMARLADPTADDGERLNSVVGTVWMIEYQGTWVKVSINLPDGEEFVVNVHDDVFFANPVDEGDTVVVRWTVDAVHALVHRASSFETGRLAIG